MAEEEQCRVKKREAKKLRLAEAKCAAAKLRQAAEKAQAEAAQLRFYNGRLLGRCAPSLPNRKTSID